MKAVLLVAVLGVFFQSAESLVNGQWASWSGWSGCAPGVCAGNQRIRTRTCSNPVPSTDGAYCVGDNAEQHDCMIDGGWTEWSQWSQCENPCGGSYINRTRSCDNPKPTPDGKPCTGKYVETKLECIWPCPTEPLDGQWSEWSQWSKCPKKCGIPSGTFITRTRRCNSPPAMSGGKPCQGNATEAVKSCFSPCAVNGGFTLWSSWSKCSRTCGNGMQRRSRSCTNPLPRHGGHNCTSDYSQMKSCKLEICPGAVDGGWSAWATWSQCTEGRYCLRGSSSRSRTCNNPPPRNGGDECAGLGVEKRDCPTPEQGCSVYIPNRPDKAPTDANSYIKLECDTDEKFTVKGANTANIPTSLVNSLFSFMSAELQNAWFGVKMEDDEIDPKKKYTKVCIEIIDPLHILKMVNNKATYYNRTDPLPAMTKPGMYEYVTGLTVTLDESASNYYRKLKKYEFQIRTADEYVPQTGFKLKDVRFSYYTEGNTMTFKAKGNYKKVPLVTFKTEIKKDVLTGTAYAIGKTTSIKFNELMASFGVASSSVPDFIKNGLKKAGLWEFTMAPAEFAFKLAKGATYRFTGSISAGGVPVHVEVLTSLRLNSLAFAVGFSFDRESFGALTKKLSDMNIDFLNSLGVEFEIGVSFSPPKLQAVLIDKETGFSKEPLKSQITRSVHQGLFIGAQIVLPKDCKGNKFCEVTKNIIGPTAKAYFNGLIEWKKVTVRAGFANIHLGQGFYFNKLELYVIADWNKTKQHVVLGFTAEVKIPVNGEVYRDGIIAPSNELILGGNIEYDFTEHQVAGKIYFRGMWRKAYFIKWLSLGNILLGLTYKVGAPIPITGLQFGMRAEFGYDCLLPADFKVDGHCFGGSGYFGIGKPQFFYGDITALTIGKICRMISKTIKLPEPIDVTGFPEGATVAYATEAVDLRIAGGPYILQGFTLKGRLNIFGWSIFADIQISDTVIYIDIQPDPVKIGSIAKIVRSPSQQDLGPKFYIHMRKTPIYWDAYIEGYIELFSISVYTRLNMTMSHMELLIQGNFLNLIKAEVFVAAEYSIKFSFGGAKFYVRVKVDLSGINAALDAAAKAVDEAFKAAQKKLSEARQHVIEKKAECKRKMSLKCDSCRSLKCKQAEKNCKGALDKFGKWVGGVVNAAGQWISKTVKKIGKALAPVGKFFKKIFKGWRRKRELQEKRHELFSLHIRRRRFISKLICEGIVGGGCKTVSYLCEGTCKAIEYIGKGLCNILDLAIGFLKGVEAACGWVSKAINFVLTQLFRIHSIKFEFAMESYIGGMFKSMTFNAAVDLTIFGKRLYLALGFSLTNPLESLRGGSTKATNWYKDKMNPKGRTDTEKQYYDKPNPFADFEMSEQFSIENQQSATDDRKGGCLFVESNAKNTYVKVTGCNETDERQSWAYTLKGQIMNTWSRHCIDTNGASAGNKLIQTTCNPSRDDQNFQCDLVVRTVKRRRVNVCWQAGDVSVNGPGSLVHLGSLKCIHVSGGGQGVPGDGTKLVIHAGCNEKRLEFALENGYLKHKGSGKCVAPTGKIVDGVTLGLFSNCGGNKFSFTKGGSLQHVGSRKCVNTRSASMKPGNGEYLVLINRCENSDQSLEKQHLMFNFIPTDPYVTMRPCTDFGNPRLNQRFEVENEPIATICTKFAKNLAHKKNTAQSSTSSNGFSERAVDENYNSDYSMKSCTHTKDENNPWWRVDLGSEHIITDLLIVNRYKNFERLKNFDVRVGVNSDQSRNPTCNDRVRTVGQGQALRLQCNPPIPGRYVAVQMFGKGILSLCEVAVYSRIAPLADLCQLENGNCQHICYNLCNLKVKCGCYPGFRMAYDGKTCIDVDECQVNNGGCDPIRSRCINIPGGHICNCRTNYQPKENAKNLCEDFNECSLANAGCEHGCKNTEGSFNCTCFKGYKLKSNGHQCQDIDECSETPNNGGCAQKCENYQGGYACSCDRGYRLMPDDKGCEEIYCPALEAPFRGSLLPSTCADERVNIRRNTMCTYQCPTGYKLANGGRSLTCNIDGTWAGKVPYCKPEVCPVLPVLTNGGLIPKSCSMKDVEHGMRCVYYCKPGYELRGPRYTTCNNTQWSEPSPVSCVRVYQEPWIRCPADIVVDLTADSNTAVLGFKWQLPVTNMKTAVVSPSNLNENYAFPAGKIRVKWTATNPDGVSKSCYYYVIVQDKTAPKVQDCPKPFTVKSNNNPVTVSWKEPVFTDNVAVVFSMSNKKPGHQMQRDTAINIRYTALDAAGNKALCDFHITTQSITCPRLQHPANGNVIVTPMLLYLRCNPGYYFNPKPAGARTLTNTVYRCMAGQWKIYYNGGYQVLTEIPACAGLTSPIDGQCKAGSTREQTLCINCAPGTFHNQTSGSCQECDKGTYMDLDGMTACQPCDNGHSTKTSRSTKASDCLPLCSPGSFSDNGLEEAFATCEKCPKGSYQVDEGQTSCLPCPFGSTTTATGSISLDACVVPASISETYPERELIVDEGDVLLLECFISGRPTPAVTWSKVGASQPSPDRVVSTLLYDLSMTVIGRDYVISKAQISDSGTYECRAQNSLATAQHQVRVVVQAPKPNPSQ